MSPKSSYLHSVHHILEPARPLKSDTGCSQSSMKTQDAFIVTLRIDRLYVVGMSSVLPRAQAKEGFLLCCAGSKRHQTCRAPITRGHEGYEAWFSKGR